MNILNVKKLGVKDALRSNLKLVANIWKNFLMPQNLFLTKAYTGCGLIDFKFHNSQRG